MPACLPTPEEGGGTATSLGLPASGGLRVESTTRYYNRCCPSLISSLKHVAANGTYPCVIFGLNLYILNISCVFECSQCCQLRIAYTMEVKVTKSESDVNEGWVEVLMT